MMTDIEIKKCFTIRTANQTLPLVQTIVEDVVTLSKDISDTQERLSSLSTRTEHGTDDSQDVYSEEVSAVQHQNDRQIERLDSCIDELMALHVVAENATDGYVDFPALRNGESVYLCWRNGERAVTHWHRINESCHERRLIDLPLVHSSVERTLAAT